MTAEEFLQDSLEISHFYHDKYERMCCLSDDVQKAMIGFSKTKCKELLEIVAEKAKIVDEDNDVYEQPHVFICHGEEYKTWVDKNSILNAVDLDVFIK